MLNMYMSFLFSCGENANDIKKETLEKRIRFDT